MRRMNEVRILSSLFRLRADVSSLAVDKSLPTSEVITDSVKHSSRARVFHFYVLLYKIVSVLRNVPSRVGYGSAPSAWGQEQG